MLVWKNTSTLDGYDEGLSFTENKDAAEIALLGSKSIHLGEFPKLKGIFRAGIGKDNVHEEEASDNGILVRYPSQETIKIIFDETATYTCSLIFRMLYQGVGTLDPWIKEDRTQCSSKILLVIGTGNIGKRVAKYMKSFMRVRTYDILENDEAELIELIKSADCITLHIPKTEDNEAFFNGKKLKLMKNNSILINTARGQIVDEEALYGEIKTGRIRAAFDVFWQEPYSGNLKEFHPDKFYMSPHIASTCSGFLKGCRRGLNNLISEVSNV